MTIVKFKLLILSLLALSVTACGGSKKLKSDQVQDDITRPPKIAVSKESSVILPKSADEEVSYEQWLKENPTKPSPDEGAPASE